jgi:prophage regulatory protein
MTLSFLRLSTVRARTGLSRSTLYRRISEGSFPAPIPLGGRSIGWLDADINEWINGQLRARDALAARTAHANPLSHTGVRTGQAVIKATGGERA